MKTRVIFEADIEKVFSEKVQEYMEKGFTIHVGSMCGSQGEIAKVDLSDGTDVYRVYLYSDMARDNEHKLKTYDVCVLAVEKHEGKANTNLRGYDTIWNGRGEVVEKITWFKVSDRAYVSSEEIKEISALRWKRWKSRENAKNVRELNMDSEERRTIIRDICRKHKGYMRVKRAHIHQVFVGHRYLEVIFTEDCGKLPLTIKK